MTTPSTTPPRPGPNETFVRDTLRALAEELPPRYSLDTRFEDLGVDSLNLMDLVLRVEDELGVTIPDDALAGLRSPAQLVGYLDAVGPA